MCDDEAVWDVWSEDMKLGTMVFTGETNTWVDNLEKLAPKRSGSSMIVNNKPEPW